MKLTATKQNMLENLVKGRSQLNWSYEGKWMGYTKVDVGCEDKITNTERRRLTATGLDHEGFKSQAAKIKSW